MKLYLEYSVSGPDKTPLVIRTSAPLVKGEVVWLHKKRYRVISIEHIHANSNDAFDAHVTLAGVA